MKFLNMISIRKKLVILVVYMIVIVMSIGYVGYKFIDMSNDGTDSLYNDNMMKIDKLNEISTDTGTSYTNFLRLMLTKDINDKLEIIDEIKLINSKTEESLKEFEDMKHSDEEDTLYTNLQNKQLIWNNISEKIMNRIMGNKDSTAFEEFENLGEKAFEDYQKAIAELVNYNNIQAEQTYQKIKKDGINSNIILGGLDVVCSILSITFGLLIIYSITKPMNKVVKLIEKTAALDLQDDTEYEGLMTYKDETGIIARAVESLRKELRIVVGKLAAVSDSMAASSEELAATTEENTKTIHQVVNAVNEIAIGNNSQADTVAKANESIVAIVGRIDVVNSATEFNSENAEKSLQRIENGQNAIQLTIEKIKDNVKVSDTVKDSIHELSKQMEKVVNIIDVISTISKQTNLLSLNASIEAARAGEAGRGFAVVAAEISKLSSDTDKAVNEITDIITKTVSMNQEAAKNTNLSGELIKEQEKAINTTSNAFSNIKTSVEDIAEKTLDIAKKVNEIDASSKDISNQVQDMSALAQEAAASSEEISATSEEQLASIEMIAAAANELSTMATELNNEIGKFQI